MDSEQLIVNKPSEDDAERMNGFKKACVRVGLAMVVFFLSSAVGSVVISFVVPLFKDSGFAYMLVKVLLMVVFAYLIPIFSAKLIFKVKLSDFKENYYQKPKYMSAALTLMPACYALSMLINWLTQLISMFFTNGKTSETAQALSNSIMPSDMPSAIILFIYLVVCAPVFEELFFRGFLLKALRPYGNGVAIFITGFLFGIFHGNYIQCFFAIAFGIVLAYIAIHTGSIITGMIIHAITNALAGIIYLFMGTEDVRYYLDAASKGIFVQPTTMVKIMSVYIYVLFTFILISIIVLILKLRKIKKYSVPKVWESVPAAKRYGVFLTRFSVIAALVLALDAFTFNFIARGGIALVQLFVKPIS